MTKRNTKNERTYTVAQAITLQAEANKSDPFAARRMSATLRKDPNAATHYGEEASRIVGMRRASIRKEGCADWCDPVTEARLSLHKTYLTIRRPRGKDGQRLHGRAFVERAA